MNNLRFITLILFLPLTVFSQDIQVGGNYYFKTNIYALTADYVQEVQGRMSEEFYIEAGHKVQVIDIAQDIVYFKYPCFVNDDKLERTYCGVHGQEKIYKMNENRFIALTNKYYDTFRGFGYGAYTVPIRIRGIEKKFEFDTNLSLGTHIVGRIGLREKEHAYIDFSLGISVTKVNLNKENSLLGSEGSPFERVDVLSPAALTFSGGILINLTKNVNMGFYLGIDKLSSADNMTEWIYNNKRWMGLGLNITIRDTDRNNQGKAKNTDTLPGNSR